MAQTLQKDPKLDTEEVKKITSIDGQALINLVRASLTWLKNHQSHINSLNVFPVPDGDTGTNMYLTLQSSFSEISNLKENNIGKVSHHIAQGALMGARGNSGVILSQLLRGFARALDHQPTMNADLLINAFVESKETAYKGVVKPVEGTILTVSKDIATAAENARGKTDDILEILQQVLVAAESSVKNTPNLLPILKQAGVVDSGGKGYFIILEGMYRFATRQSLDLTDIIPEDVVIDFENISDNSLHDEIEPGQDFEVVVDFNPNNIFEIKDFYNKLSEIGTSIQVGEGDNLYRMHIHVPLENRFLPIDLVASFGTVQKVYMENLLEQVKGKNGNGTLDFSNPIEEGQIAVIAVSPGDGISKIFQSLGVSKVISGGQSMNPSTNDIFDAFKDLPTDNVIILPNNKNIVMASEAAKKLSKKNVAVIPTKSIPQGLVSCLRVEPTADFNEVVDDMLDALEEVDSGEITTATRSIKINGVNVKKGEVIALLNGKLINSSKSIFSSCKNLLQQANTEEKEHITIFYGQNTTDEMVNNLISQIEKQYPDHEIEVHDGGQPHYQFIISIE